jgi:hypothetical protein
MPAVGNLLELVPSPPAPENHRPLSEALEELREQGGG